MASPKKYKVLVVTGGRMEYGLLRSVMRAIQVSSKLELRVLATGDHVRKTHGYSLGFIRKDGFKVSSIVKIGEKDSMLESLSKEIKGITEYCQKERPDMIMVLGDRDEPFAAAIVGGHMRIPVAHIHGGDVTGHVVDEYIRHAITKFSHLHFTATPKSYRRVLLLGEEPNRVHYVGGPGMDEARSMKYVSKSLFAHKFKLDKDKKWLVVLQHPAPLDKASFKEQIYGTLGAISDFDGEKIIVYGNSDTGSNVLIKEIEKKSKLPGYRIFKTLDRSDYLHFMKYSDVLIGNSSSGLLEAGFFKLPVVNIGNRQGDRECGKNVIHTDYQISNIKKAIKLALSPEFKNIAANAKHPYGEGLAGKKIVSLIEKNIGKKDLFYKKFTHSDIK